MQSHQQVRGAFNRRFLPAFTLIELMVGIGIIVVLVGLLIPAVMRANRSASKARTQADFQTIAVALEAYKQDFADIPRLPTIGTTGSYGFAGNPVPNTGAAILGKALLGPYGDGVNSSGGDAADPPVGQSVAYHPGDCVRTDTTTAPPIEYVAIREIPAAAPNYTDLSSWAYFAANDNADGPGFKVRTGAAKVWGPYIQPGKMKSQGVCLLDHTGLPILYFPARPGTVDITKNAGTDPQPYVAQNPPGAINTSLYDASDNFYTFRHDVSEIDLVVLNRIRIMAGNYSCLGYIDSSKGDTPVNQPYLLWSAGSDGIFGPAGYTPDSANPTANQKAVADCDDVTNFR